MKLRRKKNLAFVDKNVSLSLLPVLYRQLNEIEKVLFVVNDIDGYETIKKSLDDLKDETEKWLNSNFEQWRSQSLMAISMGDLTYAIIMIPFFFLESKSIIWKFVFLAFRLKDDKPVVEFEKDGRQLMQVTFKKELVMFCSDVREFEDLGFRIPIELRNTAMHAIQFMGYARKLQQIATFHNTIGDRIIPCVRPILLQSALKLSNLVRSESVAWNDENSVERYISMLQVTVNSLSRDNNLLTEYHEKTKIIVNAHS